MPGARLAVRIQPRASRNEIVGWTEGVLHVRLTAPPVEGAANRACIELVAARLDVRPHRVRLIRGEKGRKKVLEIEGLNPEELEGRLSGFGASL